MIPKRGETWYIQYDVVRHYDDGRPSRMLKENQIDKFKIIHVLKDTCLIKSDYTGTTKVVPFERLVAKVEFNWFWKLFGY